MTEIRKLKAYSKSSTNGTVPEILLKGQWLKQYGFTENTYIAVECSEGKLVITPREPDLNLGRSFEERISSLTDAQKAKLSKTLDKMGIK